MTVKEFANMLDGRECGNEITNQEKQLAKELGYVVVFVDDFDSELVGAIQYAEYWDTNGTIYLDNNGVIKCDYGCKLLERYLKTLKIITPRYYKGDYYWSYETDIPHETFGIYKNGEKWCLGIVFDKKDIC